MTNIIVSIIIIAIVTALVTQPGASKTIKTLFSYFAGAASAVLGTK